MSVRQESRFPPLFSSDDSRENGQSEKRILLQPISRPRGSALMKRPRDVKTSGYFSTRPAHVTSEIVQRRQKNMSLELLHGCSREDGGPMRKPQFLEMLERYLKMELHALNTRQPKAQERRLQVYREVFDCFIEDLRTYKPLLSAIKNEYEVTIAHLQDQIRELEPLRAQLVVVAEQCEQHVLALRDEERSEVRTLRQEAQRLQKIIHDMRERQDCLQTQVNVLQRDLAEQYLAYRQEHDARKLLIASAGNASYRAGEIRQEKGPDDPVKMKLELTACREDLTRTQLEVKRLQDDFVDVVPHRDWEALNRDLQESQLRLQTLQADFDRVKAEYDTLLEVHGHVALQRDGLQKELDVLQGAARPQLHWEEGGTDLLGSNLDSEGQSNQQLKEIFLEKQGGSPAEPDVEEFFTGLGNEESVPVYLRYEGKLKDIKLKLADLVKIIQAVWRDKVIDDEQREERMQLPQFLRRYLEVKHGDRAGAWAYSLVDACRKHREHTSVSLFYDILTGKVDEAVYHRQTLLLSRLLKELISTDVTESETLSIQEFSDALQRAFPLKGKDDIKELVMAAQSEMNDGEDVISYQIICAECSDRPHRYFLKVLMKQADTER